MSIPNPVSEMGVNKVILNKADGTSETLIDLTDATLSSDDTEYVMNGWTAYGWNGVKIEGAMPKVAGGTYSPSTSSVTIAGNQYLTSDIVFNACSGTKNITSTAATSVAGYANAQVSDANLTAANIAEGVTILGVTGTMSGAQIYTQDLYVSSRTQTVTFASMGFMPKYWCVFITSAVYYLSSYSNFIAGWRDVETSSQGMIYMNNQATALSSARASVASSTLLFDSSISSDYKLTITLGDTSSTGTNYYMSFQNGPSLHLVAVG